MKVKYFNAETREEAAVNAANYFGCEEDKVTLEFVSAEEDSDISLFVAMTGTPREIANMDAHYKLFYEEDGVYLELYGKRGAGRSFDNNALAQYISKKKLGSLFVPALQELTTRTAGRGRIAGVQDEYFYGEDMIVEISDDECQATAVLLAPEPGGQNMSIDEAKQKIYDAGVLHGIDIMALTMQLEAKDYGVSNVIAAATAPVNGDDGKLIFNFSIDERTKAPREIGSGKVDYRSLDLYVPVEQGALLVTRTLATDGKPGISVRGKSLIQSQGKDITLPKGKNVEVNHDKTEMHASCAGMVEFVNNSVNVSNVYNIKGDCDLSVGNIDFDGTVHITGSLRSGNTVKATGAVIVDGSVEAATIIAGGNVEVKGGMQGADKGLIEAGGAVTIMYVERGTVHADGPVTLDVSIHSIIESGDTLTAKGKRGAIIGGRAGSSSNIIANYIGALSNARTEVFVGVMPRKRARLQFLENEIARLEGERLKLNQLDAYLAKSKTTMDNEAWQKLKLSGIENRKLNTENLLDSHAEKDALLYELEHATEGRVHVLNTVFSGSRVLIGNDTYVVNNEIDFVSFRYNDSQVVYGPCEVSKGA